MATETPDGGNESLTCQIDVVNVVKEVSHELEEPPSSFRFSIPDHARYVSYFVNGLIKYYLGANGEASRNFEELLRKIATTKGDGKNRLMSYCKAYLGRISFERGDKKRALRLFEEANFLQKSEANTKNIQRLRNLVSGSESEDSVVAVNNNDNDGVEGLKASLQEESRQKLPKRLRDALENSEVTSVLDLRDQGFVTIPESVMQLEKLTKLVFTSNRLTTLPGSIGKLKNLTTLTLTNNKIASLPQGIAQLQNLKFLRMNSNHLKVFPESLTQLQNLFYVYLKNNQIKTLPQSIAQLQKLRTLYLDNNRLTSLPEGIAQLKGLRTLSLKGNPISAEELQKIREWLPGCNVFF